VGAVTVLAVLTDGLRWWGALAGFVLLWMLSHRHIVPATFKMHRAGIVAFAAFLVIAGSLIPVTTRWTWLAQGTLEWACIVLAFWTCAALAGWLFVLAKIARPLPMALSSGLLLGVAIYAAALTDVA
jgi:hypothetical protein